MQQIDLTVIAGDLVRSGKLSPIAYQTVIQQLGSTLTQLSPVGLPAGEIFRGDSFQLVCHSRQAIHIALQLKLTLKAAGSAVRLSLCRGPIEQLSDTLAQSRGSALLQAGHQLDQMRHDRWLVQDLYQPLTEAEQLLLHSCAIHLANLTARQASVLLAYLQQQQPAHQQLADQFAVSRVNITNLLKQAQYDLISAVDRYFSNRSSHMPESQ